MRKFERTIRRLLLAALLLLTLTAAAYAADYTAQGVTGVYSALHDAMLAQKAEFTIEVPENLQLERNGAILVRGMGAYYPNPDGSGADLQMVNITDATYFRNGNTLYFRMHYLLTQEQLAWVDTQVEGIVKELQLDDATDFMKVKRVYEYMGTHFTYDNTLTKYTDYDGLTTGSMVCQGYAQLTYKLLWKCGVPCRIVVGISHGEAHGWNIVKLDGVWYNLDTTWDAGEDGTMDWLYFLKNDADFTDHTRDERFAASAFYEAHPMAKESYPIHGIEILIDGTLYSGLTIRNGKSLQFGYLLHPESESVSVRWSSSHSEVASITEDGLLESLTPGQTIITATADDDAYMPDTFPVTAVDLRTCSPWADEALNSYYLRQLYPAALCSDFQTPIRRDEYAELLYKLISKYRTPPKETQYITSPMFNDIAGSEYVFGIIYCGALGIMEGTAYGQFSPAAPLTREQAAELLYNTLTLLGVPLEDTAELTFTDTAEISDWAVPYVQKVVAAGVMQGTGEAFDPQGTITREQCAVAMERIVTTYFEPPVQEAA